MSTYRLPKVTPADFETLGSRVLKPGEREMKEEREGGREGGRNA